MCQINCYLILHYYIYYIKKHCVQLQFIFQNSFIVNSITFCIKHGKMKNSHSREITIMPLPGGIFAKQQIPVHTGNRDCKTASSPCNVPLQH
jgi:hypothetical protein